MELKGRLGLIAGKVPACDIVCDIGTDHGYIPIYLVKSGRCKRAIASDIGRGPLLAARGNIREFCLEEAIETRLGPGLGPIKESESDVIIIAGMGGVLVSEILTGGVEKARKARTLILQPMSAIEVTREWLYGNGFEIYDEEMISEGEKIYNVIAARWTGETRTADDIYYYIGEKLIEKKDPLLEKYIRRKLRQIEKVIEETGNIGDSENPVRGQYLRMRDGLGHILEIL